VSRKSGTDNSIPGYKQYGLMGPRKETDMLRSNWRAATIIVGVAALMVAGSAFAQIEKGKKAPEFSLKKLDGKDFKLKPLVSKGDEQKKVVVLAFWGSWCPPCRAEAPHLQALYEKYGKDGLTVVGVAVQDDQRMVQRFVDYRKLSYTIVMDTESADIASKYGAPPIPRLYVLDRDGIVRFTHLGYSQGAEQVLEKEIKQLIKEMSKA
jgi:cytochrome c biogenesis protein CcmG/thiol:disulfide interchange protein DsbE